MKIFIAGSSLPAVFVTLSYLGYYFDKAGRPADVPIEMFALGVPFLFGLFAELNERYIKNFTLTGILLGLTLSFIGRFALGLNRKLFGLTYEVHIYAIVLYALIFTYIVKPIIMMLKK